MKTKITPHNYLPKKIKLVLGTMIATYEFFAIFIEKPMSTNLYLDFIFMAIGIYLVIFNFQSSYKEI